MTTPTRLIVLSRYSTVCYIVTQTKCLCWLWCRLWISSWNRKHIGFCENCIIYLRLYDIRSYDQSIKQSWFLGIGFHLCREEDGWVEQSVLQGLFCNMNRIPLSNKIISIKVKTLANQSQTKDIFYQDDLECKIPQLDLVFKWGRKVHDKVFLERRNQDHQNFPCCSMSWSEPRLQKFSFFKKGCWLAWAKSWLQSDNWILWKNTNTNWIIPSQMEV